MGKSDKIVHVHLVRYGASKTSALQRAPAAPSRVSDALRSDRMGHLIVDMESPNGKKAKKTESIVPTGLFTSPRPSKSAPSVMCSSMSSALLIFTSGPETFTEVPEVASLYVGQTEVNGLLFCPPVSFFCFIVALDKLF